MAMRRGGGPACKPITRRNSAAGGGGAADARIGITQVNVVPCPTALATLIAPPNSCTNFWLIANPKADVADYDTLIRMLQQQLGFTVVMVTHDLETLAGLASRVAVLADQRIIACGSPSEVIAVDHPFIRSFFASEHATTVMQKAHV